MQMHPRARIAFAIVLYAPTMVERPKALILQMATRNGHSFGSRESVDDLEGGLRRNLRNGRG